MKIFSIKTVLMAGLLMILANHAFAFGPANGYGDISVACDAAGRPVGLDTTVCVQFAGASAPKAMGAEFALNFLTTNASNLTIYHYSNIKGTPLPSLTNGMAYTIGAGDLNVWTGIASPAAGIGVSGSPMVLSFAALHSMDGYGRLTCQSNITVMPPQTYYTDATASGCAANPVGTPIPMSSPDSQEPQIDFASLILGTECTSSTPTTYTTTGGGTIVVQEVKGCSLNNVRLMGTTVGASDVKNTTYKNVGPTSAITNSLSVAGLTPSPSFFIPFQFAVSSSLVYTNPKTGVQEQPRLTREVVQSLFNGPLNIPAWNMIPGFDGNSQSVFLCMRLSGSGTKASVNSTVLSPVKEYTALGYTGANYAFNFTGGDMKSCVSNPPAGYAAIGYINADSLPTYPSALGSTGSLNGVILDGFLPYADPNFTDPKGTIKNMVYPFFTQEQLTTRTAGDAAINAAQTTFITTFEAAAVNPSFLIPPAVGGIFNAGKFWVAPGDMCSTRANTDITLHKSTFVAGTCPAK